MRVKQIATLDSSFWINAQRSGLLPYVLANYDLRCAPSVAAELEPQFPAGREFQSRLQAGTITLVTPSIELIREYGAGERATLNLALGHADWLMLMDDLRPFQEAIRRKLRVICTPVLTLALFSRGEIDAHQALSFLARLAAIQTVSPHLLAAALAQLGRSLRAQKEQ